VEQAKDPPASMALSSITKLCVKKMDNVEWLANCVNLTSLDLDIIQDSYCVQLIVPHLHKYESEIQRMQN
jgi:hypothetical protein